MKPFKSNTSSVVGCFLAGLISLTIISDVVAGNATQSASLAVSVDLKNGCTMSVITSSDGGRNDTVKLKLKNNTANNISISMPVPWKAAIEVTAKYGDEGRPVALTALGEHYAKISKGPIYSQVLLVVPANGCIENDYDPTTVLDMSLPGDYAISLDFKMPTGTYRIGEYVFRHEVKEEGRWHKVP